MKPLFVLVCCLLSAIAMAADDPKKTAHHGTRLGACSKEAHNKGLKGPERKKYISTCLGGSHTDKSGAPTGQSS
jgi:hypothetical protein